MTNRARDEHDPSMPRVRVKRQHQLNHIKKHGNDWAPLIKKADSIPYLPLAEQAPAIAGRVPIGVRSWLVPKNIARRPKPVADLKSNQISQNRRLFGFAQPKNG
jgi:hypothetical protein